MFSALHFSAALSQLAKTLDEVAYTCPHAESQKELRGAVRSFNAAVHHLQVGIAKIARYDELQTPPWEHLPCHDEQ